MRAGNQSKGPSGHTDKHQQHPSVAKRAVTALRLPQCAARGKCPVPCVQQVVTPLLLSQDEGLNWPRIVAEDIVRHTQQLQNKMFMMTGKIQGKPLLPLPEHLVSWEDSGAALDWWVAPLGARKAWQGPGAA
ncbi:hypothetical protein EK904_000041 [Melospiza melodia maxima]|nr:hypothetical protein EK904_000041 [Melospiza melodia maxima]